MVLRGLFSEGGPMLSGSAFTACCVELSDCVLWAKAYLVDEVIWMSSYMCEVLALSSFNSFGQFFSMCMLVVPVVCLCSVYICGSDLHRPPEKLTVPCIHLV